MQPQRSLRPVQTNVTKWNIGERGKAHLLPINVYRMGSLGAFTTNRKFLNHVINTYTVDHRVQILDKPLHRIRKSRNVLKSEFHKNGTAGVHHVSSFHPKLERAPTLLNQPSENDGREHDEECRCYVWPLHPASWLMHTDESWIREFLIQLIDSVASGEWGTAMTNTKQVAQAELSGSLLSATDQDAGAFSGAVLIATHA